MPDISASLKEMAQTTYTADCPACAHEFQIKGEMQARDGLRCPVCYTDFVPEKIHRVARTLPSKEETQKLAAEEVYTKLKDDAGSCFAGGVICIIVAVLGGFVAAANGKITEAIIISSGAMSLAIIFFFFSQCLHIRAALQKLIMK